MTDGLEKLFGSTARVKLLRHFLFNPRHSFLLRDIVTRARVQESDARKEIALLRRAGVIDAKRKGKDVRYTLSPRYAHTDSLRALLLNVRSREEEVVRKLRGIGAVRGIILLGLFVGDWESDLDLLVIGDKINDKRLRDRVHAIEADLGREIRYTLLSSQDFFYRLNMSDKLVRDILDFPHTIALDKLNIGLR